MSLLLAINWTMKHVIKQYNSQYGQHCRMLALSISGIKRLNNRLYFWRGYLKCDELKIWNSFNHFQYKQISTIFKWICPMYAPGHCVCNELNITREGVKLKSSVWMLSSYLLQLYINCKIFKCCYFKWINVFAAYFCIIFFTYTRDFKIVIQWHFGRIFF